MAWFSSGNPLLRISSVFLVALSLSIGWGIRGNYGHEFGAMFPGCVAALAACLLSGREDWRQRAAYFAFFGAVGWGFGGSFSYMQVISYTHSGHLASQVYGFFMLFVLGFLWAAIGGAGTALPAVFNRSRLNDLFKPISVVFAFWTVWYFAFPYIEEGLQRIEDTMKRHESAIYWFDSDWLEALIALAAVCVFDFFQRHSERGFNFINMLRDAGLLLAHAALGVVAGVVLQLILKITWLSKLLWMLLVRHQGDATQFAQEQLIINFPNFLIIQYRLFGIEFYGWHLAGAIFGLICGVGYYFYRYGSFRCGSSLLLYMALGWFACFVLFPCLLGVRMTPPRGDNWAGVLGVCIGANAWFWRNGFRSIVAASLVCGIVGGIGFSGIACLKLLMVWFGNAGLLNSPATAGVIAEHGFTLAAAWSLLVSFFSGREIPAPSPEAMDALRASLESWRFYQSANWHSFLEQSYGFINGIGAALALAMLVKRVPAADEDAPQPFWTTAFALMFVVPVLTYVNMIKNVNDWTKDFGSGYTIMDTTMRMPLVQSVSFSAGGWFSLFYLAGGLAFLLLLIVSRKRMIALTPPTWLGKGQLLYLLVLWIFVLGNLAKCLAAAREQRLLTEGVILLNAILTTVLILLLPNEEETVGERLSPFGKKLFSKVALIGAAAFVLVPLVEFSLVRALYRDTHAGHAGVNMRFGGNADYIVKPLLKGEQHR